MTYVIEILLYRKVKKHMKADPHMQCFHQRILARFVNRRHSAPVGVDAEGGDMLKRRGLDKPVILLWTLSNSTVQSNPVMVPF